MIKTHQKGKPMASSRVDGIKSLIIIIIIIINNPKATQPSCQLYEFSRAAKTNYHTLGDLNSRNSFSHNSGS